MQTFLPYADFVRSVQCLDSQRLGKQRVEAMQLHNILTARTNSKGWRSHPALKMWIGYAPALALYMNTCIEEWCRRGYRNTMQLRDTRGLVLPLWIGNERLHRSHRSNLLRKRYDYYSRFGWQEPLDVPYYWPEPEFSL